MQHTLVGQGNADFTAAAGFQNALATESGINSWITRAVNKILFFIRNFWNEIFAFFEVQMAGAAGADHAAIMMEFYVVV